MRYLLALLLAIDFWPSHSQNSSSLPGWKTGYEKYYSQDWLIQPVQVKAAVYRDNNNKDVILYNGLVKRTFRITPDLACTGYKNMVNGQELLRATKPEARLTIDGKDYNVGGLYGQKENAYLLPEWVDNFKAEDNSFHLISYEVSAIKPYLKWKTTMWTANKKQPEGKMISFKFRSELTTLKELEVSVNYELYDGLPLISKSLSVKNNGMSPVKLDRVVNEILGMVEEESAVVGTPEQMKKPSGIYLETNYAFNNAMRYDISDQTLHWKPAGVDSPCSRQRPMRLTGRLAGPDAGKSRSGVAMVISERPFWTLA
jgi:hypothetical protein